MAAAAGGVVMSSGSRVIPYDGALREPGDRIMFDGGQTFELREYVAAPFLPIVGPALSGSATPRAWPRS